VAKLKGKWDCVCGHKGAEYVFIKPSIFTATTTPVQCDECGSRFNIKNKKKPGMNRLDTHAEIHVLEISKSARKIVSAIKPKSSNPFDKMG
jgi:DNA-directed RNA polymerase subunit RPC12/RpoP